MMRKFKLKCGYIAYEATIDEIALLGGFGICDECNELALAGYLIPVLNHYMCPRCFEEWVDRTIYYPEDIHIETQNAKYYESKIPTEGDDNMPMYYDKCPNCGANLDPGEVCDCDSRQNEKLSAKKIIEDYAREQKESSSIICPRCGGNKKMYTKAERNALSRHANVYICSQCGMDEAVRDMIGTEPLNFEEWAIVKQLKRERDAQCEHTPTTMI